jgi:hypothetical protein
MRALIIFVYLVLLLFRGYARIDGTIHDKPVCTHQALKKASSKEESSTFATIEAEEDDDYGSAKKFKLPSFPSKFFYTIVVSHPDNYFDNRLPVGRSISYRYILLSSLRI